MVFQRPWRRIEGYCENVRDISSLSLINEFGHLIHRKIRGIGTAYDNIFHCCTWKSASQWFVALFSHPYVIEYSEMGVLTLTTWFEHIKEQGYFEFDRPDDVRRLLQSPAPAAWAYPRKTVGTTLYYSYDEFLNLPLPRGYRAFFVMRDPRDLVVSWYFSMRDSHVEHDWVRDVRSVLRGLDEDEGLEFVIERLAKEGLYDILRSWGRAAGEGGHVAVLRFEDLARDHADFIRKLFVWLRIRIPEEKLVAVIADTAFAKLAGRAQGSEDRQSHLRKGIAGDWVNHLSAAHLASLQRWSGNLVEELGYDNAAADASASRPMNFTNA